jgi:hypothetical protein
VAGGEPLGQVPPPLAFAAGTRSRLGLGAVAQAPPSGIGRAGRGGRGQSRPRRLAQHANRVPHRRYLRRDFRRDFAAAEARFAAAATGDGDTTTRTAASPSPLPWIAAPSWSAWTWPPPAHHRPRRTRIRADATCVWSQMLEPAIRPRRIPPLVERRLLSRRQPRTPSPRFPWRSPAR